MENGDSRVIQGKWRSQEQRESLKNPCYQGSSPHQHHGYEADPADPDDHRDYVDGARQDWVERGDHALARRGVAPAAVGRVSMRLAKLLRRLANNVDDPDDAASGVWVLRPPRKSASALRMRPG